VVVNGLEPVSRRRQGDAFVGFLAAAFAAAVLAWLGIAGWLVVPLAGLVAGLLTRHRTPGMLGLMAGFLLLSVVWGTIVVARQIENCSSSCSGLSSPGLTLAIVIVFSLAAQIAAVAGFLVGRLMRRIAGSNRS
jgi:hypothetical protein